MDWFAPLFEFVGELLRDSLMGKRQDWPWWRRLLTAPLMILFALLVTLAVVGAGAVLFGMASAVFS
jgi:hypothetical protein